MRCEAWGSNNKNENGHPKASDTHWRETTVGSSATKPFGSKDYNKNPTIFVGCVGLLSVCVCVFKMFCPTFLFARFYSRWFPTRRSLLIRNRVPVSAGRLEAFSAQSPEKEWQSDQLREKWRGFSEVVWIAKTSNSELDVLIPFPKIWQKLDI